MSDDDRGLLLRAIEQLRSQVLALSQRDTQVMLLAGVGPLYRAFIARLTSVLRIPALLSLLPAGRVLLHSSGIAMYCNPFEFLVALAFDTTAIVVTSPSERALWHADLIGTAGEQNNMPAPSLDSIVPSGWLDAPFEGLNHLCTAAANVEFMHHRHSSFSQGVWDTSMIVLGRNG